MYCQHDSPSPLLANIVRFGLLRIAFSITVPIWLPSPLLANIVRFGLLRIAFSITVPIWLVMYCQHDSLSPLLANIVRFGLLRIAFSITVLQPIIKKMFRSLLQLR